MFVEMAGKEGFSVESPNGVKCPFDLILDGVVRVDVKTARYSEYGACRGWFCRIGKYIQADVAVLLQYDRREFYCVPWTHCTKSNMTISVSGGKYRRFKNNWEYIRSLAESRRIELKAAG